MIYWREQWFTVSFKSTSTGCMQGTFTCSLNVKHLQVHAGQSKYDVAALGAPRWLPLLLRQVSKRSLVTHCCFTQSRPHKLLPLITLNPFNRKSNSEMSWTRLSLADLWAKSSLCLQSGNQQNIKIFPGKKSFVRLWKKNSWLAWKSLRGLAAGARCVWGLLSSKIRVDLI